MALTIERVLAWEALDSRGTPTVACAITLTGGAEGQAAVPSGASTGSHEAHELRDGGTRFGGKGVRGAVAAVRGEIAAALHGCDAADQEAIDDLLRQIDGRSRSRRQGNRWKRRPTQVIARAIILWNRQVLGERVEIVCSHIWLTFTFSRARSRASAAMRD